MLALWEEIEMKIVVFSCDNNEDTWEAFHHCLEKYWPTHPEVIYKTETKVNPYYTTICKNYPLNQWSRGMREALEEIKDKQVLFMADDVFIRKPVDEKRLKACQKAVKGNTACINLELAFDIRDEETSLDGIKKRQHGSAYEVSIMCGIWQREALIKILSRDGNPWDIESRQETYGYDFFINGGDYIIDWGYRTWQPVGICRGQWVRETLDFLKSEGIEIEMKRGVR